MREINQDIFRLYDIRGIYPKDLNEDLAYQVGRYFIRFLRKNSKKKKFTIAIAKDIRHSSPKLFQGFSRGVRDEGCDVVNLGLITTPMLYFAVSYFGYDGGVIITASHNPNPYNGLKMTREKAIPLAGETGIFWLRDRLQKEFIARNFVFSPQGSITRKNISKEYLRFILQLAGIKKGMLRGFTVALDAGNGVGGPITLKILRAAGVSVYPLYCEPDGSFPNHVPDPLLKENLKDIVALVKQKKPDLGIALDGDADRIIFVDEKGKAVPGDLITALMSQIILRKEGGGPKILYDLRSSNIVGEVIKKEGGEPVRFNIGHALIKEKMRRDNIIFGGELSGHYYLGRNIFYEVPCYVLLSILKEIQKSKTTMSRLIRPFQKYFHSGEINFEIKDKEGRVKELAARYSDGKILTIDGVRVDYDDWWFLVRPSNTEPVLRLVVEARTKKLLVEKKKELIRAIGAAVLTKPLIYRTLK